MDDFKLAIIFITIIFILGVLITTLLRLKRDTIKECNKKLLERIILITDIIFMIAYIITIIVVGKYSIHKFILLFK